MQSGDDDDQFDTHACTEAYDTAAAAMGIWAATHPSAPAATVGLAALGTHLTGEVVCNGGIQPGPPPDFLDAKLGYDPAHAAPPSFSPGDQPAPGIDLDHPATGFDYASASANHGDSFDYGSVSDHVSDSFDYGSGSNTFDSGGAADGSSSGGTSDSGSRSDG